MERLPGTNDKRATVRRTVENSSFELPAIVAVIRSYHRGSLPTVICTLPGGTIKILAVIATRHCDEAELSTRSPALVLFRIIAPRTYSAD